MNTLKGKIVITSDLKLITGMHIGTSGDFAAIGAVDSIVIRDPYTKAPIIPGSTLKGKMRHLLSRVMMNEVDELPEIKHENQKLKRLFGSSDPIIHSRLKFNDIHLTEASYNELLRLDLDLPFTEIKFENTISRATGVANPRQLERIPAGAIFRFEVIYDIDDTTELEDDIDSIKKALEVLEYDYLGGHGTRGYGRVKFGPVDVEVIKYHDSLTYASDDITKMFE